MNKKLNLLLAGMAIISMSAFAQDGKKPAPRAQEPVKVAPVTKNEKAETVSLTGDKPANAKTASTAAPAPAPAKKRLVKKNVVAKNQMKAAPVSAEKQK